MTDIVNPPTPLPPRFKFPAGCSQLSQKSMYTCVKQESGLLPPLSLAPCTKCSYVLVLGFMHEWRSTLQNMRPGFGEKLNLNQCVWALKVNEHLFASRLKCFIQYSTYGPSTSSLRSWGIKDAGKCSRLALGEISSALFIWRKAEMLS